ncbi:MAG TPA: hypothetical protein VNI01_02315 [Elusimicrobiota bacterium]|nr:hypothetical protein [Elusimicrobiota bacterium]
MAEDGPLSEIRRSALFGSRLSRVGYVRFRNWRREAAAPAAPPARKKPRTGRAKQRKKFQKRQAAVPPVLAESALAACPRKVGRDRARKTFRAGDRDYLRAVVTNNKASQRSASLKWQFMPPV